MNKQILDFWVGNFNTEEDFYDFVEENDSYYLEEESDDNFVSKFAESQNTVWFDNELIEYGFEYDTSNLYEAFSEYSFADQWLPAFMQRLNEIKLKFEINSIIFVSQGQIPSPKTIENDDFSLTYIGGIEFEF